MKNLGVVGLAASLGPSSGVPTSAWALCMPLPRSPVCERNRMPGLLTVPGLFSESRQLPLTEPPPPSAQNLPSLEARGLGPLPSLQMIPLRVSAPPHPVSNSFSFLCSAGDPLSRLGCSPHHSLPFGPHTANIADICTIPSCVVSTIKDPVVSQVLAVGFAYNFSISRELLSL